MSSATNGGPPWLRIARENFRFLRRYTGNQIFLFVALILFSGYAESFGIAMFLPIFTPDLATRTDPASRAVVSVMQALGAQPTLGGALPIVAIFFVLKGVLAYLGGVVQHRLSAKLTRAVRREMIGALAVSDYGYVVAQTSGRVTNLVTSEVSRATAAFLSFSRLAPSVVNVVLFFGVLVFLDWKLTIAITVAGGAILLTLRLPARITRTMSAQTTEASVRLSSLLIHTMHSFKYLVATGRFARFSAHTNDAVDDLAKASYRIGVLYALTGALSQPVMVAFLAGVIYWQVLVVGKSLAALLLVLMYMYRIMLELFAFQAQWQEVAAVSGGLAATVGGMRELEAHREPSGNEPITGITDGIELTDVTFSYGDAPVLHDVSLRIPRRSMVAFVGESGAGKSTLVDVLSGLLRPQAGTVSFDGKALASLDLAQLRRLIGFVPQECVLFDDTAANNISLWDDTSGDPTRVERAAQRAHCDEFLRALPQGYATPLGERGVRLSGGQRQRLAIARELFRDPELLILDEATSALDTESERYVQQSIDALKGHATIVVIAHRLSTVKNCDQIHVMSGGRVVESGSFSELYARPDSRFRRMCDLQALL